MIQNWVTGGQSQLTVSQPRIEQVDLNFSDASNLGLLQRMKDHSLINSINEFRREMPDHGLQHTLLHTLIDVFVKLFLVHHLLDSIGAKI